MSGVDASTLPQVSCFQEVSVQVSYHWCASCQGCRYEWCRRKHPATSVMFPRGVSTSVLPLVCWLPRVSAQAPCHRCHVSKRCQYQCPATGICWLTEASAQVVSVRVPCHRCAGCQRVTRGAARCAMPSTCRDPPPACFACLPAGRVSPLSAVSPVKLVKVKGDHSPIKGN